jgi:hypothetical protein
VQNNPAPGAQDPKDATYLIEGTPVTLKGGEAQTPAAPGSASMVTTKYFGNELKADLNGDGKEDEAFILTQNTGGSGTFYYAVAAIETGSGYVGSDAYLLGDRIAPQATTLSQNPNQKGVVVFNYADRKPNEPMTATPSVGKSAYLKLDENMRWGVVEPNFEGEAGTPQAGPITIEGSMVCLPHKNTSGPQTTECAFGLKDDAGRYFALSDSDPNYQNIMGVGTGDQIRVEGTFTPRASSNYQDIGIITVTKITSL